MVGLLALPQRTAMQSRDRGLLGRQTYLGKHGTMSESNNKHHESEPKSRAADGLYNGRLHAIQRPSATDKNASPANVYQYPFPNSRTQLQYHGLTSLAKYMV